MAKTKKIKEDHDEEIMKGKIQKRFEQMFTGEGEPLSNLSLQEVEKLKERVMQLENELAGQSRLTSSASGSKEINKRSSLESTKPAQRERKLPHLGVSAKSILTFTLVFILAAILQFQFSFGISKQEIEQSAREHSQANYEAYVSRIVVEQNTAEALATSLARRTDIQELYQAGDKEALYQLLLPTFLELKEKNRIVHLYLENPNGTVFLRVHDPEHFGDDVTYRGTLTDAIQERRTVSGIEIGANRIGVRGVAPMYAGNNFIGLVEVGLDFDEQFVNSMKDLHGADYSMWITNEAAAPAGMKPRENSFKPPLETMFYYTGTISQPWPISAEVYREVLNTGEPAFEVITQNTETPSIIYIVPLRGYKNKIIGILEIADSYSNTLMALKSTQVRVLEIVGGLALLGMALIALFFQRLVLRPLGALAEFAKYQLSGDTSQRVFIRSNDEFERLATSFNNLADSVDERQRTLEQRVLERTHDLELASQVGRAITEKIENAGEMLATAAELIRNRFMLYYTQVYLIDPAGQKLVLQTGTGEVGKQLLSRRHKLLIDTRSLNGQAVLEKKPVIVADTRENPSFKPNPLLPNTRSEMVVPLILNGQAIGVLDMQSEQPDTFTENNLAAFEAIAGQLAVALQNAGLLAEAEEARAEVEAQVRRLTEQGWRDFLDAIEHGQKIGFAFEQSKVIRLEPNTLSTASSNDVVSVPISVTGTQVGEIHLPVEKDRTWTSHEIELIKATGAQLAQHIENLRLLAQADQYRAEAQQAVKRLTREGWDNYLQTSSETEPGYIFDLTEVKPLDGQIHEAAGHSIKHPMIVRDEMIGELAVNTHNHDEEVTKILEAVGKQLSDHLENLRLSELNEKRAYREHALRQITSALRGSTNPVTIMRTAVRELGSILGRRAVVQLKTPAGSGSAESGVLSAIEQNSAVNQS